MKQYPTPLNPRQRYKHSSWMTTQVLLHTNSVFIVSIIKWGVFFLYNLLTRALDSLSARMRVIVLLHSVGVHTGLLALVNLL
jgi:hypothetical protein